MLIERIKMLSVLPGVPGHEDAVRQQLRRWAFTCADEIVEDVMGNLLVFKRGVDSSKTCMFAAHMDEVGLIVTSIADDGRLRFDTIGSIDRRILPGQRVRVGKDGILGVISDKKTIDVGAAKADDVSIASGDTAYFDSMPQEYGDGWLKAKALDDRVGCAVLSILLEQKPAVDTWAVFTVQEEVGLRGAMPAAARIAPDYAYVLEATTAADLPDVPPHKVICRPGNGVVLPFMDKGTIYTPSLLNHLHTLADENGIARQTKEMVAGGTDAAAIQRAGRGAPVAGMAVAARSLHSPISAVKLSDVTALFQLASLAWRTAPVV
ncbi:MAG: M42 family peptidase [Oscillospiraceae bacterium]|nr:M42 family peptidase [Oscillospiraceae bacterium]